MSFWPVSRESVIRFVAMASLITCQFTPVASPAQDRDANALPQVKHLIDTHIHFYDTDREKGVPWPPKSNEVLYHPHFPGEFADGAKPVGVTGVVIVEASTWHEDNQWILDLVKDDDLYLAYVAYVDLTDKAFDEKLSELTKDPRVVGVRARGLMPDDYASENVRQNIEVLADRGLTLDILVNGITIQQVDQAARDNPDLIIVGNHVLGRQIDGKSIDREWQKWVERVAENKNVYCKISGLYERSSVQPAPQELEFYRPCLDVIWKHFGEDRVIYGSNWPVTKQSGDYASFIRLVNRFFADKGQEAKEDYFWRNAAKVYRLGLD